MRTADNRDLDERIDFFTTYCSLSPAMISRVPGMGLARESFKDADGELLHGATSYRLNLPKGVPAAQSG